MRSRFAPKLLLSRTVGAAPGMAAALVLLMLSACATTPPAPLTMLPPEAQLELLRGLQEFSLNGRVAIRSGTQGGENASMTWQQTGEQTTIRLSAQMGMGSLTVNWRPGALRLTGGKGEDFVDAEAEQVLVEQLGFMPPFEALRFWVLGLPAPGELPTQQSVADSGRISELVQQGWQIRYDERWLSVAAGGGSGVELPRELTVTRDDLRLRLLVEKWEL
jgi:outer membrane lipoprotein LolB